MRSPYVTRFATATATAIALAAVGLTAGCDSSVAPAVAAIGRTSAVNGRAALIISPGTLTLAAGSTYQLNSNAPTALQNQLQWSSLEPTVASVSPSGSVIGWTAGSATITVRYSDDTVNVGTATITVTGSTNTATRLPTLSR